MNLERIGGRRWLTAVGLMLLAAGLLVATRIDGAQWVDLVKWVFGIYAGAKIKVDTLDHGLLVNYCQMVGAHALVKGFRNNVDLDYELPMAQVNQDLAGVETIFIPANPEHGHISSSLVKQVADLEGSVTKYVPQAVARALASSLANRKTKG